LLEAEAAVTEVATYIEASQKELATRQAVRDAAQAVLDKLQPLQTNGELIQAYLASQRETLRLRGEQIARVTAFQKENGFKLADLMPKRAPLDSAMARKTQRGTQRPGSK
jgi:catechol-2,3-dioxygenase